MPTNRYVLRRSSRAKLTHRQELELWLGVSHSGSAFRSDEERKALWFHHRERLMRWFANNGKRPCGWWWYEAVKHGLPPKHPGIAHQTSILYEFSDALGENERSELEAWWREQFDKTWREGFSYFHEGRVFTGQIARELCWVWMDLPVVLHDRWMAERERRGRVVHELQQESQQETVAETGSPHEAA